MSNNPVTPVPIGSVRDDPFRDTNTIIYESYSGSDIFAQMVLPNEQAPLNMGELSTISYSMHREQTPIRALGRVNVRGFVRGPRTIAGSMIFTQFNAYAFYRLKQYKELAYGTTINQKVMYPLADMLPPFDVVLTFSNEYGSFSRMKILGMVIVDEGGTFSIENIISEQEFTFMAMGLVPMTQYIPDSLRPRYNFPTPAANSANRPTSPPLSEQNF